MVFPSVLAKSGAALLYLPAPVKKVSAAEESPARVGVSLGGGGDGRGEGQSPFKFTNPRVGMTGSCPLGGGGFSHPHDGAKLTFYSWF